MKHAYLIMAHGSWQILKKTVSLLDSEKNDLFFHIDVKSKDCPDINEWVQKSKVYFIEPRDIKWASFSQTECELELLKKAIKEGEYSYYHLLSGVDLPLKPADEIYNFFENSGQKIFLAVKAYGRHYSFKRVAYYHDLVALKHFRNSKMLKVFDKLLELAQCILRINRLNNNSLIIADGWTWFSITDSFAKYVISQEELILNTFKRTIASDEMFLQTIACNSRFLDSLYDRDNLCNGSMRYIDWERGTPYVWGKHDADYDLLINSPCMFARKFDENHMEIVEKIYASLGGR